MRITAAFVAVSLLSCSTGRLSVKPATTTPSGVVYSLPQTGLKVTIAYTVVDAVIAKNGATRDAAPEVFIRKPVQIQAVSYADPSQMYVASGDALSNSSWLTSSLQFDVADSGYLAGLNAATEDKTLDALGGIVSAGVNAAKLIAVAGPDIPVELQPVVDRIDAIYSEIGKAAGLQAKERDAKYAALRKELDYLLGVIKTYNETNANTRTERELTYVQLLDTSSFIKTADNRIVATIQPTGLVTNAVVPAVVVELAIDDTTFNNAKASAACIAAPDGVVYREPLPVVVQVKANATLLARDVVEFSQFGRCATLPVNAKRLGTRNTVIAMNSLGGLKQYKVDAQATADKTATAVASSIASVQDAVGKIRFDMRLEQLQKQKQILDAQAALQPPSTDAQRKADLQNEKDLLTLELEIEKLKKDLAAAKGP